MKILLLASILFASPACVLAQNPPPGALPAPPLPTPFPMPVRPSGSPAENIRYQWLEIATAFVVDMEFDTFQGTLTFGIEDGRFKGIRFRYEIFADNPAARASAVAAVVAELRHTDHLKLQVALAPDGKVRGAVSRLTLCYAKAK